MEWTSYANEIRSLLGLEGSPVAVTFSMEPVEGAVKGKHLQIPDSSLVWNIPALLWR